MDAINAIKNRHSVRKYNNTELDTETIKTIIDCARLAPSGYNAQPWKFVVVNDNETKTALSKLATSGRFMTDAGAAIAVFCDKTAPTYFEDGCAATENILIAATAFNLGTCWINSHRKTHSEKVAKLLNAPENYELISIIVIGESKQEKTQKSKKALEEVLYFNKI